MDMTISRLEQDYMKTTLAPPRQRFMVHRNQTLFVLVAAAQLAVFRDHLAPPIGRRSSQASRADCVHLFPPRCPGRLTIASWAATRLFRERQDEGTASVLAWTLLYTAIPALVLGVGLNIARVIYYSYDAVPRVPPYSSLRLRSRRRPWCHPFCVPWFGPRVVLGQGSHSRRTSIGMMAMWGIGIALLIGLLDPHLMIDTLCLSPYVGPAFAMGNGFDAMVDTFSQYGPNFVIFAAAFAVAPTFYMATAIITALNVAIGLAFVFDCNVSWALPSLQLCGRSVHRSISAGVLPLQCHVHAVGICDEIFAAVAAQYAALVQYAGKKSMTSMSVAALILCSLWSFEALTTGLIVYLTCSL